MIEPEEIVPTLECTVNDPHNELCQSSGGNAGVKE